MTGNFVPSVGESAYVYHHGTEAHASLQHCKYDCSDGQMAPRDSHLPPTSRRAHGHTRGRGDDPCSSYMGLGSQR
uniref:Uncharacterized protein n=1 Tax=Oryza brachyantha TaxID=4533 RepID=J3MFM5_ORYBR